jgi:hypothetical protein
MPGTAPGTPAISHCEKQAAAAAKIRRWEKTVTFFIMVKFSTLYTKAIGAKRVLLSFAKL